MQLQKSTSNSRKKDREFQVKGKIGSGQFGEVERCIRNEDGLIYAVKSVQVNPL